MIKFNHITGGHNMNFITAMDLSVTNWINSNLHTAFLDRIVPFITSLGDSGFIWIVFCCAMLIPKKTRPWGVMCAAALLLTTLIGEGILKHLFARARPFTHLENFELLIAAPLSYSFPSGHSASSFAGATSIFFMNRKLGYWAYALAVMIALSRLYLSVHFLTDVFAGCLLGVVCAYFIRWMFIFGPLKRFFAPNTFIEK